MPLDEKEASKVGGNVSSENDFESEDDNWKLDEQVTVRLNPFGLVLRNVTNILTLKIFHLL